jgi:hypothetical protein
MGIATHLGPWLLGTVKNTTGTTAGTIRNVGATHSYQSKVITTSDTTANTVLAVLPAGSLIQSIAILVTNAYITTTPTFAFFVNGAAINTAAASGVVFTATGRAGFTLGNNSAAGAVLVSNVGTTDAILSFTQTTATANTATSAILEISYIVRNADGTYVPTSSTGP